MELEVVMYKYENLGRGLTKTTHVNFEELSKKFSKFAIVSQFSEEPTSVDIDNPPRGVQIVDAPNPSYGEKAFGIGSDSKLTFLMGIIDSSD
jgi:hypothetical protein